MREEEAKAGSSSGSNRESPAAVSSTSYDKKTPAEKRFEEVQKKRVRSVLVLSLQKGNNSLAYAAAS